MTSGAIIVGRPVLSDIMSTEHVAPPRGRAVLPGEECPSTPFLKAETLFVPERKLYPVSIEDMVDFGESPELSPEVREAFDTPWLATAVFPLAAKCFWRLSHGVGTAEIFAAALRDGALKRAGFSYTPEEASETIRGFIVHDLGTAYTDLPEPVLNRTSNVGPLGREEKKEMNKHPRFGIDALAKFPSTPDERKLVGGHHFFGDRYGVDPNGPDADRKGTMTDGKLIIVSTIDVGEARTNVHRLYHTPDVDEKQTRSKLWEKFYEEMKPALEADPGLIDYIARRAHAQREFELKATPRMSNFINSLRRENKGLWEHPDRLAANFALAA